MRRIKQHQHRTPKFFLRAVSISTAFLVFAYSAYPTPTPLFYLEYLRPRLEQVAQAKEDLWDGPEYGGYLFRFQLDLDGDGIDELFVTSSLEGYHAYAEWTVFRQRSLGQRKRLGRTGNLPMTSLRIQRHGRKVTILGWGRDRWTLYFASYRLVKGKIEANHQSVDLGERATDYDYVEEAAHQLAGSAPIETLPLTLEVISLYDFLRNPQASWVKVEGKSLHTNFHSYVTVPTYPRQGQPPDSFTAKAALEMLKKRITRAN